MMKCDNVQNINKELSKCILYVHTYTHTYVFIHAYVHVVCTYVHTYGWMDQMSSVHTVVHTYEWMNGQTSIEVDSCSAQAQRETQAH